VDKDWWMKSTDESPKPRCRHAHYEHSNWWPTSPDSEPIPSSFAQGGGQFKAKSEDSSFNEGQSEAKDPTPIGLLKEAVDYIKKLW
jgi:hypothetical protein